jgi:hypothetical protein
MSSISCWGIFRHLACAPSRWGAPVIFAAVSALIVLSSIALQAQTNAIPSSLVTNFEQGVILTPKQVEAALQLAAKCGIKQPGEIRTFHFKPSAMVGVSVRGIQRDAGRKATYDEVTLRYAESRPGQNPKDLQFETFSKDPPYLRTIHLLAVTINGAAKRIQIDDDIPVQFADMIINEVTTRTAVFRQPKSNFPLNLDSVNMSNLASLTYNKHTTQYCMRFDSEGGWRGCYIYCAVENGRVVIISISPYVV